MWNYQQRKDKRLARNSFDGIFPCRSTRPANEHIFGSRRRVRGTPRYQYRNCLLHAKHFLWEKKIREAKIYWEDVKKMTLALDRILIKNMFHTNLKRTNIFVILLVCIVSTSSELLLLKLLFKGNYTRDIWGTDLSMIWRSLWEL